MDILIFIWIGKEIPKWIILSLTLNSTNINRNTVLICSKTSNINNISIKNLTIYHYEDFYERPLFLEKLKKNKKFNWRNEFWIRTIERFFILDIFIRLNKIDDFYHAELDNLVFDLSDLRVNLGKYGEGLFCPRDSDKRCIASLIYINNKTILKSFCEYIESRINYNSNDMMLLSDYIKANKNCYSLPTENSIFHSPNWDYLKESSTGGIFDAASIGQYLFGTDIRNNKLITMNGFVNENSTLDFKNTIFEIDIKKMKSKLTYRNSVTNIYNIHIHSKNFELFNSNLYKKIINRINNNNCSIIGAKFPFNKIWMRNI